MMWRPCCSIKAWKTVNAPSSTVCPAPNAALPSGPPRSVARPSQLARRSTVRSWARGHATTPSKSCRPQCRHEGELQGWHETIPRRPTGVGGPPGSGCRLLDNPSPPPLPLDPNSGCSLPVAPLRWSPFGEEEWSSLVPVLYLSFYLLRASVFCPPLCVRAAPLPSPSLSLHCVFLALSVARPKRCRARRWHTEIDIDMTRRYQQPCGTRISRSCMSTWAHIFRKRRQPDNPIILDRWVSLGDLIIDNCWGEFDPGCEVF